MGDVFKARDKRLGRIVAIKVLHAPFSDRFLREARAIAALNHPRICPLYDIGENYLVMEYVEGRAVQGPLPLAQVFEFTAQMCEAIEAAHRKGVIHRDLKPSNLLITGEGIKLLDFGIARILSSGDTMTEPGVALGTLAYMAPEVVKGSPARGIDISGADDGGAAGGGWTGR